MNNGYERVNERKMLEILQNLEKLTGGYLKVYKRKSAAMTHQLQLLTELCPEVVMDIM